MLLLLRPPARVQRMREEANQLSKATFGPEMLQVGGSEFRVH